MTTYVPNATQATEPVESRTVESAALEFRTLKESVNTRIAALTADFDTLEVVVTAEDAKDLRVPEATVAPLPAIAVRAGKALAFDAGGDPTVMVVGESADSSLRTDLAASSGSLLVGYMPAGTGAVATTVQSKLRETVSVKDFGMSPGASAAVNKAALDIAIAEAAVLGKDLFVPAGVYSMPSGISLTNGVGIVGEYGSSFVLANMTNNFMTLNGNNRIERIRISGTRTTEEGYAGPAVFRVAAQASNIKLIEVDTDQIVGNALYLADASNIWLERCRFTRSSSMSIVLNDDIAGSSNIYIDNCRFSSYGIGVFNAESDDTSYVVQSVYISNSKFIGLKEGGGQMTGGGIWFTKGHTTGAGAFKKYRDIRLSNVQVENCTDSIIVRGANGVSLSNISVIGGAGSGVEIGLGNTTTDFFLSNFKIETSNGAGISIQAGHATEKSNNIFISDGWISGLNVTGTYGIITSADNTHIRDVKISGASAAGTIGVRVLSATDCSIIGCQISGVADRGIMASDAASNVFIADNTVYSPAGACAIPYYVGGSDSGAPHFINNRLIGYAGSEAFYDDNVNATRFNNIGVDRFHGRAITAGTVNVNFNFAQSSGNYLKLASRRTAMFSAKIVARRSGSSTLYGAAYLVQGLFKNDGGVYSPIGTPVVTTLAEDVAGLNVTVSIDSANGLLFTANGSTNDFWWRADVELTVV